MKNDKKHPSAKKDTSTTGNKIPAPTIEEVRLFVTRDLQAAHYFLGLMLRYPDVINAAADEMYQHAMTKEQGSAIDHVKSSE